jgi:flagellin-like protein
MRRKKVAVSELVGTLIMVAITLIAGAAVFGWINGQAGTSENAYGASVANNVNFLRESFVVVTQTFTGLGANGACNGGISPHFQCTGANFWVYNNGQVVFTLSSLRIKNLTDIPSNAANPNPLNLLFYSSCSGSNCGYAAYNKLGTATVCSNVSPLPGLTNLAQGTLSNSPYQVSLPSSCGSQGALYLYDGLSYTFTFTGLYGNTFATTVTVNG